MIPSFTGTTDVPTADPELLNALGDCEAETDACGSDIIMDLVKKWDPVLKDGPKKEEREEILQKYMLPKNCPLIKAPILNPEIRAMLNESARKRDTRLIKKQPHLGYALSILGKTIVTSGLY